MFIATHAGARAQIVNAAFQILEPWVTKSNLSTRIKTLYEKTDDFKVAMGEQLQAKREAFLQDVHASLQKGEWQPSDSRGLCQLHSLSTCVQQEAKGGHLAGCAFVHAMFLKGEPVSLTVLHCLGVGAGL